MLDFKYSPVDVKDKIMHLFPELSFFQPYIDGVFDGDPKRGRVTVGVRTPWYDIVYVEVISGSFWQNYVSEAGLKCIITEVRSDLDAAVTIQTEFGQGGAMCLDKSELAECSKDPDAYINNRRENKLSKPKYTILRRHPTVYVNNTNVRTEDHDVSSKPREKQERTADFGVITAYVKHNNLWSDRSLVEAHEVIFLCACGKCQKHADHILELRREKYTK